MQKAAFQALQLQKDSVHGYIRNQVCVESSTDAKKPNTKKIMQV